MRTWITAPVLAACAACGDGNAAPDAVVAPDDQRGLVSIQVVLDGPQLPDIQVYFQNVDSSLVLSTRTRPDGRANAYMAAGGFVTVAVPFGGQTELWTYSDVQPGDQLVVDPRYGLPVDQVTINVTVPVDPGAVSYELYLPCNGFEMISGAEIETLAVSVPRCKGDVADALVRTVDDQGTAHFIYEPEVPVWFLATPLFTGPYVPSVLSTIRAVGVPPEVSYLTATQHVGRDEPLYPPQFGSSLFPFFDVNTGWTTSAMMPVTTGMHVLTRLDSNNTADQRSTLQILDWRPFAGDTTFDLYADRLPPYLTRPVLDVPNHSVTWTEGAGSKMPETVVATIRFNGIELGSDYTWTMVARRRAEPRVTFPVLPPAAANPRDPQFADVSELYNIGSSGGYDQIRTTLLSRFPRRGWPQIGASGHVVIEGIGFFP